MTANEVKQGVRKTLNSASDAYQSLSFSFYPRLNKVFLIHFLLFATGSNFIVSQLININRFTNTVVMAKVNKKVRIPVGDRFLKLPYLTFLIGRPRQYLPLSPLNPDRNLYSQFTFISTLNLIHGTRHLTFFCFSVFN